MEILNNFWTILTTESVAMTKLVTLPFLFIEAYLTLYIFSYFLKVKYSSNQKYIYIIVLSTLSFLNIFVIPAPFNVFINYFSMFLLIYFLFKLGIIKSILAIVIPTAIFALTNTLVLIPYLKIINVSSNTMEATPIYKFIYSCIVYAIVWIVISILRYKKFSLSLQNLMDRRTKLIILFNAILGIFVLILQAALNFFYVNVIPIAITLLNFILLLLYFVTSFFSLTKVIKLHITARELENAESYNNTLSMLYDNVRGFKHDFDNIVNSIGGYINNNDMDGLKKYYSDLEKDCVRVNNAHLLNPLLINNSGIYNLVVSKHKKATEAKVNVHFDIFFDFDDLKMPIYEFSRILGILLDNAIEAAKECKEKQVNLVFRVSPRSQVQIMTIENTYKNKDVDTKKIFEKGISGKKNHSGIGLWEINQIIMKHNNIVLRTTKDDKIFKQQLEIYY